MKQLVKLNKRPLCGGQKFTYVLRYIGEDGLVDRARVAVAKGLRQIMVQNGAEAF